MIDMQMINCLAGADYDPVTVTVSFAPNQEISCVLINNIIDDNIHEVTQCFSLVIKVPSSDSRLVPGGRANVNILDDDQPIISSSGQ